MAAERVPKAVVVVAFVGLLVLVLPLAALLWRAPWARTGRLLSSPPAVQALRLSLVTSLAATALCLALGVPLAWVLARLRFPGRRLVLALTTLPMVLPPVVGGVALLLAFGRRGLVGGAGSPIRLPFTTAGAVLAEAFVALPFLVVTLDAALASFDRRLEEAARTLGAGPWAVFRRVTLPGVRPALVGGAALCWARALGEFGATITFAGNLPGHTRTLPLFVYVRLESGDTDAAVALSVVLLAISVAVLYFLRGRWLALS